LKVKAAVSFWLVCIFVSLLIGLASSLFLQSLDWVTEQRIRNDNWLLLLPLAGFLIGYVYNKWGQTITKGNNLLLDEFHVPQGGIPFKMSVFIFGSTLLTHLVGGSAGREGTAVQMGGAIAHPFKHFLTANSYPAKFLIVIGISAGFAAVFGTPWAATIFALEVIWVGKSWYKYLLPSVVSAFVAHYSCLFFGSNHTEYIKPILPAISITTFLWIVPAAIGFGLTARLFTSTVHLVQTLFKKQVGYPPLRPAVGGVIILIFALLLNLKPYLGLGIPSILDSFEYAQSYEVWLLKLGLTALTLGCGFKGGEVTPLFFIGATLGSALSLWLPLPVSFLAATGFVAVFAGAANTPISCAVLGMELFGIDMGIYILLCSIIAYYFSGKQGIYASQKLLIPKIDLPLKRNRNK
jgi:H+/Cl- antiporter ClcA